MPRIVVRLLFVWACLTTQSAWSSEPQWRHGTTLLGTVKYKPTFTHFDYVNPKAPKGGTLRMAARGGFDSFNVVPRKGNSAALLGGPSSFGLVNERLMKSSYDEPSSEYGLIAEAVKYPDDFSWVTYRLNPKARWQDGKPITSEDVVWSFDVLKKHNPQNAFYYRDVEQAKKTGEHEVTFTFSTKGNRELPHIVGQLIVLPKHWWDAKNEKGESRDISKTTLEVPLGSGPYHLKDFKAGQWLLFERNPNYWGKDLPVNIGYHNYDEIKVEYFKDSDVQFQAFKADIVDFRSENTAKNWALAYEFPAVKDGRIIREMIPETGSGIWQGFALNQRRKPFDDIRIRNALNLAYNFEEMNRTIFYDQYERIASYFHGTELAAKGKPGPDELKILETVRDLVPEEVFGEVWQNPVSKTRTDLRKNLRNAFNLMKQAGFVRQGTKLVEEKSGKPLEIEFLYAASPSYDRIALAIQADFAKLGVTLKPRPVDAAQYTERFTNRDFDMVSSGWPQSLSPGNEQLEFFGSNSADREGSRNAAGIKNPAVDKLIEHIIFAKDRKQLVAAAKALDRVLLVSQPLILQWNLPFARLARWDRFSHPEPLLTSIPASTGLLTIWWYDEEKAAKTREAK